MTTTKAFPEPTTKTFVLEVGSESWPVNCTDDNHTFACWTLQEAIHDAVGNMLIGYACRIVATPEWEARNGKLADKWRPQLTTNPDQQAA